MRRGFSRLEKPEDIAPPGIVYKQQYASFCVRDGAELKYGTCQNLEAVEELLERNAVEAIRINEPNAPDTDTFDDYTASHVTGEHNQQPRAVVYGESEYMLFHGAELL